MSKKEEKAKEYSDKEVRRYHQHSGIIEKYGMERARVLSEHESWELEEAYEAGWDEALKSQWINVKDKLPATGEVVLVLTSNGKVSTTKRYQPKDCRGKNIGLATWKGSTTFVNSIIAWMPILSFDNVLKNE